MGVLEKAPGETDAEVLKEEPGVLEAYHVGGLSKLNANASIKRQSSVLLRWLPAG